MTKKFKLLLSSSALVATAAIIPLTIVACGAAATTDMTQAQASAYAKVSPTAISGKNTPPVAADVAITNANAKTALANLGITLTLGKTPEGVTDFTISSYTIVAGPTNTSVIVTIKGKSGATNLTTSAVTVTGFTGAATTDMTNKEFATAVVISSAAIDGSTTPKAAADVVITNANAVAELAKLGITLTLNDAPAGKTPYVINSYTIATAEGEATSVNVTIKGTSGNTEVTTIVKVNGFTGAATTDMTGKEFATAAVISSTAIDGSTTPEAAADVTITKDSAIDALKDLGITLTLNDAPAGKTPYVINSYTITTVEGEATSVNVTIKGTSGNTNVTTIVKVTGFNVPKAPITVDGIQYKFLNSEEVSVQNYTLDSSQVNLTIPDEINDGNKFYKVVKIEANAFKDKKLSGTLIIPDSVSSIGQFAFSGNKFSGNLKLGNNLISIGNNAFHDNKFSGSLIIPESVTSIGNIAFAVNQFSASLKIGNSVTSIGQFAFAYNQFSGDLVIPNSVTSIGNKAFISNLFNGSLTIPDSVTSIGTQAFSANQFNGSLTIGNSVTSIGIDAFSGNSFTSLINNSSLSKNEISGYGK